MSGSSVSSPAKTSTACMSASTGPMELFAGASTRASSVPRPASTQEWESTQSVGAFAPW